MRIKLLNIQVFRNLSGTWRMEAEIGADSISLLHTFLDELKGREVAAELRVWHKQRSLDANAYAWVLIDKIAQAIREDKVSIYRAGIREIGGNSQLVCVLDADVWELFPGLPITTEELDAYQTANLQDGGQSAGSITIEAFGDVPEIDIPVRIIVRGDLYE